MWLFCFSTTDIVVKLKKKNILQLYRKGGIGIRLGNEKKNTNPSRDGTSVGGREEELDQQLQTQG